jgi:hypothetical protein
MGYALPQVATISDPHGEEARLRAVSKHEARIVASWFETPRKKRGSFRMRGKSSP